MAIWQPCGVCSFPSAGCPRWTPQGQGTCSQRRSWSAGWPTGTPSPPRGSPTSWRPFPWRRPGPPASLPRHGSPVFCYNHLRIAALRNGGDPASEVDMATSVCLNPPPPLRSGGNNSPLLAAKDSNEFDFSRRGDQNLSLLTPHMRPSPRTIPLRLPLFPSVLMFLEFKTPCHRPVGNQVVSPLFSREHGPFPDAACLRPSLRRRRTSPTIPSPWPRPPRFSAEPPFHSFIHSTTCAICSVLRPPPAGLSRSGLSHRRPRHPALRFASGLCTAQDP